MTKKSTKMCLCRAATAGTLAFALIAGAPCDAQPTPLIDWYSTTMDQSWPGFNGVPAEDEFFGYALAAGDFDCDGFADLAVGTPGQGRFVPPDFTTFHPAVGRVHIAFGGPGGLTQRAVSVSELSLGSLADGPEPFDHFGIQLTTGNFNGDSQSGVGCDDLVIGSPLEDLDELEDAGQVWVLYGGPQTVLGGGQELEAVTFHQGMTAIASDPVDFEAFGSSLTAGDFNGDGFDELAIGGPLEGADGRSSAGAVWLIIGSAQGLAPLTPQQGWIQYVSQNTAGVPGLSEANDRFGSAIAACDLDQDGVEDLAIGAAREDQDNTTEDNGAVTVLFGTAATSTDPGGFTLPIPSTRIQGPDHGAALGSSITTLESASTRGLPSCQLAVGAPELSFATPEGSIPSTGEVVLLNLTFDEDGPLLEIGQRFDELELDGQREPWDRFGAAIAAADFDGNGQAELIIGVPYQETVSGGQSDDGGFYWTTTDGNRRSFFDPNTPTHSRGLFGAAFAIGDFDGDGTPDLAVGAPVRLSPTGEEGAGQVRTYYSTDPRIFVDGFESGNTNSWN